MTTQQPTDSIDVELDAGPPAAEPSFGTRLLRRVVRRGRAVATGVASFLVVAAAVAYVALPVDPAVSLGVREVSGAVAFDQDAMVDYTLVSAEIAAHSAQHEVVYGVISSPVGIPVSKAELRVSGAARSVRGQGARVRLGGAGTYRAKLRLDPGRYRVELSLKAAGKVRRAHKTFTLRAGRSYVVSITVREGGIITMLPISSY